MPSVCVCTQVSFQTLILTLDHPSLREPEPGHFGRCNLMLWFALPQDKQSLTVLGHHQSALSLFGEGPFSPHDSLKAGIRSIYFPTMSPAQARGLAQ